jgi:hypothetical protein
MQDRTGAGLGRFGCCTLVLHRVRRYQEQW